MAKTTLTLNVLAGIILLVNLLTPQIYGQQHDREKIVPLDFWGTIGVETVLSKDEPIDKNQPKEVSLKKLKSIDFENKQACIEIKNEQNTMMEYCVKEGGQIGDSTFTRLMKVTPFYVIVHDAYPSNKWVDLLPTRLMHKAAFEGDVDKLSRLFKKNASLINIQDQYRMTPLMWATSGGRIEAVEFLLKHDAIQRPQPNKIPMLYCQTPLHLAVKHKYKNIAELLLVEGADINAEDIFGQTPLLCGLRNGNIDVIKLLLKNKSFLNTKDDKEKSLLHLAADVGDVEIAKFLLNNSLSVNAKDKDGNTPLHLGVCTNIEMVKLLLACGADMNSKNKDGQTPLHFAASNFDNNNVEIVKFLLVKGAHVDTMDKEGLTPLYMAVNNLCSEAVILLLKHGVDVDGKTQKGQTSLHLAVQAGDPETLELLLENNADPNIKDNIGKTALSLARENEFKEIEQLLLKHGAKE